MFRISNVIFNYSNKKAFKKVNITINLFSTSPKNFGNVSSKPLLRKPNTSKEIGPLGWFLLVIPASTFALGTWQVKRKVWKENLLIDLKSRTSSDPVVLPSSPEEIAALEYRPVHVRGHFLHDKEIYMGPRSLLVDGESATKSSLLTSNTNKSQGYQVVTPLKLSDRDETILVNRGWVPAKYKDPSKRKQGQVTGEVDVIGIVRCNENRPVFSIANQEGNKNFFYRDLNKMAQQTGASPIFLDATNDFDVPGGPIGGQTRISLRNEHLSYILTWYSLCAATSYMWCKKFLIK